MFSSVWQLLKEHPEFIAMLTIPPVTAFVTWAHVWMALEMLFYPIKFWGVRVAGMPFGLKGLGWQGIVPAKAGKISGVIVDQTLAKLGNIKEFLEAMEPAEMADFVTSAVDSNLEELIDEIMLERSYTLWTHTPYAIKRRIYAHAHSELPSVMKNLVLDLTYHVEELVDMRQMIVRKMESDRKLMVDMFLRVGKKEINFIWKISALIGFGFGIIQMAIFYFVPQHWTVPFFAAIWGALTNWIAIWMVFNPVEPHYVRFLRVFRKDDDGIHFMLPHIHRYNWQGGFMKRQDEVSSVFAEIVVKELVTLENIMHEMMYGARAKQTRALMKSHMHAMLESPVVATTLKVGLGGEGEIHRFEEAIIDKSIDATMVPIRDPELNTSRADKIFGLFESRIRSLTPKEFQNLLRPAFKEDEMTLVVLGAITGLLAGWLHLVAVFF
ncbi:hypothetical protein B0181_03845 [Moraxella caviae]|uniref:DUF445 domain-containing protein n=1 Tax=Moraxella caviae TaxID=34060 RepID=A0A1T0A6X2_9GAMM|nr:hypothetical protein [Moraxella caviae]OOR91071.1 hypothetical protein B0181_03845 [Moraxella caviae]STZ14233.1 Uncharacterised protein [Moraxella caviae]VEW13169.1 Uncharacterised protein [Moraxella caviae]